jgi:ApaG protein
MYKATTNNITVSVQPAFLEQESKREGNLYLWTYTVRIENNGTEKVQLRARSWEIIDGNGRKQEVRGPGVVGEQPVINPGTSFEYTSGTPLQTPSGFMRGSYAVEYGDGRMLDIDIPAFPLDVPGIKRLLN